MKKSLKYLLLGILATSALAGCSNNSDSSESSAEPSSSESSSSSSGPAVKSAWTAEESAVMSEHLYGVVLPFCDGDPDATVAFVAESSSDNAHVQITGSKSIGGSSIQAYSAKFTSADGWTVEDASESAGVDPNRAFIAEKSVSVESSTKYVRAMFFLAANNGQPANAGKLSVRALDPYLYEFPATEVNGALSQAFGSSATVPDPVGSRYEIGETEEGFYFVAYGVSEGYAAKLTAAGYTVASEPDSDGYYKVEPADGKFEAWLKQADGVVEVQVTPLHSWPTKLVKAFFDKYPFAGQSQWAFPTFSAANGKYMFMEYSGNASAYASEDYASIYGYVVIIGATVAEYNAYLASLVADGFAERAYSSYTNYVKKIGEIGMATLQCQYNEQNSVAYVFISPFLTEPESSTFPGTAIATYLGEDLVDTVPAFNGALSYGRENYSGSYCLSVYLNPETAESQISAYVAGFADAGYTANGVQGASATSAGFTHYASEHGEIDIMVRQVASFECLVYITRTKWDSTEAAKLVAKVASTATDAVVAPADKFNAVSYYDSETSGQYISLLAYADASTKMSNYASRIKEAGWTEVAETSSGKIYNSPNNQFAVQLEAYTSGSGFYINILDAILEYSSWPSVAAASLVSNILGSDFVGTPDAVPALNGGEKYVVDKSTNSIKIEYSGEDARDTAFEHYCDEEECTLGPASFAGLSGEDNWISEHGHFVISVSKSEASEKFYITIKLSAHNSHFSFMETKANSFIQNVLRQVLESDSYVYNSIALPEPTGSTEGLSQIYSYYSNAGFDTSSGYYILRTVNQFVIAFDSGAHASAFVDAYETQIGADESFVWDTEDECYYKSGYVFGFTFDLAATDSNLVVFSFYANFNFGPVE